MADQWLNKIFLEYTTSFGEMYSIEIRDFLHITSLGGSREINEVTNCWFKEDPVNISLALLTQMYGRDDVLVVGTFWGQQLCNLGRGMIEMDSLPSVRDIKTALQNEEFRYVVVPCSDGM
ncbi:uncharacterized protein BDR25DRAFT_211465, partial [Lindgomyces ingoldianus]